VNLTLDFYRRNYIEGLFLSSGIIQSPDYTMEQLILVARTLRETHHFGGYIHLKTIAGCDERLIAQAGLWADRLSVNIELPTQSDLVQLAPEKKTAVIESSMDQIRIRKDSSDDERRSIRSAPKFAPAGQSTQMIVGATPSTDREVIAQASRLYATHKLRRIYYTGFSPYPEADARLPLQPTPLMREHRLYQADWLMRFYGFAADEITTPERPVLSLSEDPKSTWANTHPEFFPVDVNSAPREALLRVPGIGYKNVDRILRIRRYHRLSLEDLRKLRVRLSQVSAFVIAADHLPTARPPLSAAALPAPTLQQLELFTAVSAVTGSL
ncbi:MAG TPA: putative DNA modification/repair radical SAM protein, partial [Acidobacteriaceae bacterium]|nr:putative DNA modification/repair radical SAM protein [Acidobacteriaceae bacterium]